MRWRSKRRKKRESSNLLTGVRSSGRASQGQKNNQCTRPTVSPCVSRLVSDHFVLSNSHSSILLQFSERLVTMANSMQLNCFSTDILNVLNAHPSVGFLSLSVICQPVRDVPTKKKSNKNRIRRQHATTEMCSLSS